MLKDFGGSVDSETQPWVLQISSSVLTDPKGESRRLGFSFMRGVTASGDNLKEDQVYLIRSRR